MEAVPKIEGHAAFYTHLKNGQVDKARIIGLENDRFVEKILLGRHYYEAPIITSRICGICPTIHNVTSTKAIETACGIVPSPQTTKLRKLMLSGQMIQSHSLHLYLLVLPDYVGVSSSFELQKTHPEIFQNAIELKKYADRILEVIGGRAVHPVSSVPGGFKAFPKHSSLKELLAMAPKVEKIAEDTVRLFASFEYPKIKRAMIHSALNQQSDYAFYDGEIWTTNGKVFKAEHYKTYVQEELRPYTRAKFGSLQGHTMMVGASSRININKRHLADGTLKLFDELDLPFPFDNPFLNIIAQAIENHHFVLKSIELIQDLVKNGIKTEHLIPVTKYGVGVAACEAPRGTLFHYYELNKEGKIINCDIITPTVESLSALELDLGLVRKEMKELPSSEQIQTIEALIRAYDPCITCATH